MEMNLSIVPKQVVGKRIRDFYIYADGPSGAWRILLIFMDFSACVIDSGSPMVIQNHDRWVWTGGDFHSVRPPRDYREVSSAVFDQDPMEKESVESAFHALWSKAVGTEGYQKREWKEFASLLNKAGIDV
jgi:hypothetical protein